MEPAIARHRLEAEKLRLLATRHALAADLFEEPQAESVSGLAHVDQHAADAASELFEREKDVSIAAHVDAELAAVDAALARLSAGTYGTCRVCRRSVPDARLEAEPATDLCVDHANAIEQRSIRPDEAIAREGARNWEYFPADDEPFELVEQAPEERALHIVPTHDAEVA